MRDFKFRVWCRGWKPARYANNDELHISNGRFSDVLKNFFNSTLYIVEQFTGLIDENNREVFENDIVRVWQIIKYRKDKSIYSEFVGKVHYERGNWWVTGKDNNASLCIFFGEKTGFTKIEIIGNVNENPEFCDKLREVILLG